MKKILLDMPLEESGLRRLRALPGATVETLPPHAPDGTVAAELLQGGNILLCKIPPTNFEALTDLELMQICTVGYEHLRHLRQAQLRVGGEAHLQAEERGGDPEADEHGL